VKTRESFKNGFAEGFGYNIGKVAATAITLFIAYYISKVLGNGETQEETPKE